MADGRDPNDELRAALDDGSSWPADGAEALRLLAALIEATANDVARVAEGLELVRQTQRELADQLGEVAALVREWSERAKEGD
jgi:gas vesicle protein